MPGDPLQLSNVTKRYGGVEAVRHVSITFNLGTVTGIAGPNGAGKSTLLDVISGIRRPNEGAISIGDVILSRLDAWAIAKAGITRLFQEVRLFHTLTVLNNVNLAQRGQVGERLINLFRPRDVLACERRIAEKSRAILKRVAMEDFADSIAGELSYGQQKLVALACCLATESDVLLLDEPFAGLAATMRQHVGDLCGQLRSRGALVIVVEHDLDALRSWADRLLIMSRGEVVADGEPEQVFEDPNVRSVLLG